MRSWTSLVATGSSPEVGSSKNSTAGSLSNALASATRWRIKEVVSEIVEQGLAYMQPRIIAEMSTGSGCLRAYIESNLALFVITATS